MSLKHLNDKNFKTELTANTVPALVDFFAEWCGPCKQLAPILEQIAPEYEGKCDIIKVNVEEAPETASNFRVSSIPSLFIIKDGRTAAQHTGFMPEPALRHFIDSNI